jgi:hypothetical protein
VRKDFRGGKLGALKLLRLEAIGELARFNAERQILAREGSRYAAPEQLAGGAVTTATDVLRARRAAVRTAHG